MSEFVNPSEPIDPQTFEHTFGGNDFRKIPKFVGYTLLSGEDIGVPVVNCNETRLYVAQANKRVARNPQYAQEVNRLARRLSQQTNKAFQMLDNDAELRNIIQQRGRTEMWLDLNENSADQAKISAAETVLDNLFIESGHFPLLVRELQSLDYDINCIRFRTPAYLVLQTQLLEHSTWHRDLPSDTPAPDCLPSA